MQILSRNEGLSLIDIWVLLKIEVDLIWDSI